MRLGLRPHQVVLDVVHQGVVGAVQKFGAELLEEEPDGECRPPFRFYADHGKAVLRRLRLRLVHVEVQGVQLVQRLVVDQLVVADGFHRLHDERASEAGMSGNIIM